MPRVEQQDWDLGMWQEEVLVMSRSERLWGGMAFGHWPDWLAKQHASARCVVEDTACEVCVGTQHVKLSGFGAWMGWWGRMGAQASFRWSPVPPGLWDFPRQNTGVGNLSLLRGIFPIQGLNPGLLHCRQIFTS